MNRNLYTSPESVPRSLHLHGFPILPASSATLSLPSEGGSDGSPATAWKKTSTNESLIMSSSPHSRQSLPGNALLQELNTQDLYLSAPSDPEESDFHASAIRLTPAAVSPNHSSSANGSRRPSIQASIYVPSRPSAYLAPSDIELGNGHDVWSAEDTSSLNDTVNVPSTTMPWTGVDPSNWLNQDHSIPSPPSASEILAVPDNASATQDSVLPAQQPGLGISSTYRPSGPTIFTDGIDSAANSPRGRSPIVTVSKISRGDSPVASNRRLSRSNAHLSPGGLDELSNESEHEHGSDDHHSVSSHSVARSSDGNWIPRPSTGQGGLDPTARSSEYVSSPNELKDQREREQKNRDISLWTASVSPTVSEAGDEPPTPPPRRHHGSSRLRARSTGDRPLQREDYFNLLFSRGNQPIPGPGALLLESSEGELSDGTDQDEETYAESPPADINDPSRNDISTCEVCSSLEASNARENFPVYPWQDFPHDAAPRTEAMQPQSSTAAMVAFEMRAKDLETASLTATIDANSILNFDRLTLKDQGKTKARRSSSLIKRHFQQASSRFNLKRQASDFSITSAKTTSQQICSEVPQRKESNSSRHRMSWSSKHNRSTSVTSLLMSMSGQMAAVGGSHSVRAVSPNREASPALPVENRRRSRSEVPRPATPGLSELMTTHGGPPVAGIYRSPKQPTVTAEQAGAGAGAVPQAHFMPADDKDDMNVVDDNALVMQFPPVSRLPVPTFEGFQAQIMQLNPRLEPALIQRFAQAQMRRYKNLVEMQQKHSIAVANQTCKAGDFCFALGGKESLSQQRKIPAASDAGQTHFHVTDFSQGCDQPSCALSDGAITAAQFPPGVPLPPASRLPARFECPVCFEVKPFQKPSDWTKHVHEDLQPFTCSFPECNEPKSFKRKADWVRHENERHRQLEWWTCSFPGCHHTCYRKDNFVKHLVREHNMPEPKVKKTKGSTAAGTSSDSPGEQNFEHLWQTVSDCQHKTVRSPRQEPCRFCGNICSTWTKLTTHLAKHMEQLAMPVLELARQSCIPPNQAPSTGTTGRSADTCPPFAAQLPTQQDDASVPSSAHLARPQYPTSNASTPASHNLPYEIPTLNYPSISGGELSTEPESIADSLPPDDQLPGYTAHFDQGVLHASVQTHPLHQNSVMYPPPHNAVPRPRIPQADAVMSQSPYALDCQLQAQGSLDPAQASYPGTYQPVVHNVLYTSRPYTSSHSSQM